MAEVEVGGTARHSLPIVWVVRNRRVVQRLRKSIRKQQPESIGHAPFPFGLQAVIERPLARVSERYRGGERRHSKVGPAVVYRPWTGIRLVEVHVVVAEQMRSARADISNLRPQVPRQLMLDRDVPELDVANLEIRI